MAKADRLARLDDRRLERETEYGEALIVALRRAASGKLGLFGRDQDRAARATFASAITDLAEIGAAIDEARDQLGLPPFPLQQEFLKSRGPVGPQAPGERKQAQAWLDRLEAEGAATS
jgi:hypothetical protein